MDFEEFVQEVKDCIPEYLPAYDIETVHVERVEKNNGVVCTGLIVKLNGENISPNVYLEYYYNRYINGMNMDRILTSISEEYEKARNRINSSEEFSFSREGLWDNVFVKLVNYDRNSSILEKCPYIQFYDLAITFRYLVRNDEDGIASAQITNEHMVKWDLKLEELFIRAKENTKRLFPPVIKSMPDMLEEMTGKKFPRDVDIYVLTNEKCINGASSIIFSEWMEEFAECIGHDIFVLPSSIHELLLIPDDGTFTKQELLEMVSDVNSCVLTDIDYLSDNVYLYDAESGMLRI